MNLYRADRILAGFVLGGLLFVTGIWMRLNASSLAAPASRPSPSGSDIHIFYSTGKTEFYREMGLVVLIFGLVLVAIAFHHWLSPQSTAADQR